MIQVQGPDGSSFEFPDDTPHEHIEAALGGHYGPPSTGEDMVRSILPGLQNGAASIPGMFGDVQSFLANNEQAAKDKILAAGGKVPRHMAAPAFLPTTEDVRGKLDSLTGIGDYDPQTFPGKVTKGAATMAPGALLGSARTVGGVAADLGRFAVAPALASEGVGAVTDNPVAKAAAAIGAAIVTGKAISPLAARGGSVDAQAARAVYDGQVKRLEEEGIRTSAGDRVDSKAMRQFEDELDHNAYKDRLASVTRAATRQVGDGRGGTYETPIFDRAKGDNTFDKMLSETSQRYEDLNSRNTLHLDQPLLSDLLKIHNDYVATPGLYSEPVQNTVKGMIKRIGGVVIAGGQTMTGEEYHTLLRQVRKVARDTGDPEKAAALGDISQAMSRAMERSIATHNPADLGAYRAADKDYKAGLVIEHAIAHPSVSGAEGFTTPAAIEAGAKKVYGTRSHIRGESPFDWAPAAKAVLKFSPDSGTGGRNLINAINAGAGRVAGGVAGSLLGHAAGMHDAVEPLLIAENIGGVMGPSALKAAERPLVTSRAAQSFWGNKVLGERSLVGLPGLLSAAQAARQKEQDGR